MLRTKFSQACIGVSILALSLGFLFRSFREATVLAAEARTCESDAIKPTITPTPSLAGTAEVKNMKLGAFSISLTVKDLSASKAFYENLGFTVLAGDMKKNYLIMKNENALIGLFHGMFKNNIMTFNPGWDENGENIAKFVDVREIQRQVKSKGIKLDVEVDEKSAGPAGFLMTDPDGNSILIDQHR